MTKPNGLYWVELCWPINAQNKAHWGVLSISSLFMFGNFLMVNRKFVMNILLCVVMGNSCIG